MGACTPNSSGHSYVEHLPYTLAQDPLGSDGRRGSGDALTLSRLSGTDGSRPAPWLQLGSEGFEDSSMAGVGPSGSRESVTGKSPVAPFLPVRWYTFQRLVWKLVYPQPGLCQAHAVGHLGHATMSQVSVSPHLCPYQQVQRCLWHVCCLLQEVEDFQTGSLLAVRAVPDEDTLELHELVLAPPEELEMSPADIELGARIGQGAFGEVSRTPAMQVDGCTHNSSPVPWVPSLRLALQENNCSQCGPVHVLLTPVFASECGELWRR